MKKIALLSVFALCVFAAGCGKNVDVENECIDGEECVVDVVTGDVETIEEDVIEVDVVTGDEANEDVIEVVVDEENVADVVEETVEESDIVIEE